MTGIRVSVDRESMSDIGEKARQSQRQRMMRAATIGYNWSVERAPEDRGQLKQTSVEPTWDGNLIKWGYTQPYAEAQEFGTPPYWPPTQPLVEWAERTFGDPSIGYAVQQKIAEEGIEGKGFAQEGAERQKQAYDGTSFEEIFKDEL